MDLECLDLQHKLGMSPIKYPFSEKELEVIFAMLNGYFEDKDITNFLTLYKLTKMSTVRYNMKKLLKKFKTSSRGELFRNLIKCNFAVYIIHPNIRINTTTKLKT